MVRNRLSTLSCLAVVLLQLAAVHHSVTALPHGEIRAKTHFEAGFLVGRKFRTMIQDRFNTSTSLHNVLIPFAATAYGRDTLNSLYGAASAAYPKYMDELNGTAVGADVQFEHTLLMNFRDELLPLAAPVTFKGDWSCSDVSVVDRSHKIAAVAHNEDGSDRFDNHTYLITQSISQNKAEFTAYTYAGELPSTAFGWNSHGIGFTLNAMHPNVTVVDGIPRNFIARAILDATTLDEAIRIATQGNQATGHNYQLFSAAPTFDTDTGTGFQHMPRLFTIETYPPSSSHIIELGTARQLDAFFHANCYLFISDNQTTPMDESRDDSDSSNVNSEQPWRCIDTNNDSQGRMSAAMAAFHARKPTSLAMMDAVIGDTTNKDWPIYAAPRIPNADNRTTLNSVVFDLEEATIRIMDGNPKLRHTVDTFHLARPSATQQV